MTPRTDPFPHAARCIVRDFAKEHTWGPYNGQEALALRMGYRYRESVTPWFRGLDTGLTDGQTTPGTDARRRLWAIMHAYAPVRLASIASLNTRLRREIAEVERMITHGAYPDRTADYPKPIRAKRPAFRLSQAV